MNFKSLENVLHLFNSNLLLSTIENLVFDFVTWYSPKRQREEGKLIEIYLNSFKITCIYIVI